MRIHHAFSDAAYEVLTTRINIYHARGIDITLEEGAFEHFFLIVSDPNGEIRALLTWKTRIKHYQIRETLGAGSNHTLPGQIVDGAWAFTLVRPYPIAGGAAFDVHLDQRAQAQVNTKVFAVLEQSWGQMRASGTQWYRGDLHAHSAYSDGRVALELIQQRAMALKLDFLAMTDHSVVTTYFPAGAPLLIPATELTFDNEVHYNIFGLRHLIDYASYFSRATNKNHALTMLHRDLADEGVLLSINHPFASGISLGHDFDLRAIHLLEVMNAPHLAGSPIDNEKAIRFFDFLWQRGHRLTAFGGSDAHKANSEGVYPLGAPTTAIYCEGLSLSSLMSGLRRGRTLIENGVQVTLTLKSPSHEIFPGSEIEGCVAFEACCAKQSLCWRLIHNGHCIKAQYGHHFSTKVDVFPGNYFRLEARIHHETVFFANPIFCALKPAKEYQFSSLLTQFLAADF